MSAEDFPALAAARFRRTVCSSLLVFEALVVLFAVLVAKDLSALDTRTVVAVGACASAACLLLAGLLRHPAAYLAGSVLQVLLVASGVVVPVMWGLGALFAALWFAALLLARRVERIQREHGDPAR